MNENQIKKTADAVSKLEINQDELDSIRLGTNTKSLKYKDLYVVEHKDGQYGVIDKYGHIIVPFGKYAWIDGFSYGLARVRTSGFSGRFSNMPGIINSEGFLEIVSREVIKEHIAEDRKQNPQNYAKWGIINERGEEVLPVEYDDVWGFYNKDIYFTTVVKDGEEKRVYFSDLNPTLRDHKRRHVLHNQDYDEYYPGISQYCDYEGFIDEDRLEDAYLDGEWVPDDY